MNCRFFAFLFALLLPVAAIAGAYEDLEEALIRGDTPAAIALLNRGIDVNTVDRQGNTLLTQAIQRDLPELFEHLLQRRARLNTRNRNGESALSIAAYAGRMKYVQRLVEAGAEVNYFGWSPLSYAAYNGHTPIVEYLIKRGAEVDGKTENGSTALFFAARFGHVDTVRMLLQHQADATIINDNDETAVDWALKGNNTDIEGILRQAGGRSGKSVTINLSR